jgi:5-methylcytosine-specific restriction endonuclease McrA
MKTKSIHKLSNKELLGRVERLGVRERETTLEVLLYLIEIEKRELYLGQGYGSLYDFCIRRLGYSESAALRRIRTARCIRAYPRVYGMLLEGELSLDTISRVSKVLKGKRGAVLLEKIRGKSSREVAIVLSRYSPKEKPRDRVQPIYVRTVGEPESDKKFTAGAGGKKVTTFPSASGGGDKKNLLDMLEEDKESGRDMDLDLPRVDIKRKFKLEFAVEPEFMKKVERAKALLSNSRKKSHDFESLFNILLDEYLDRHSPEGRIKRRAAANKSKSKTRKSTANSKQSRYIPQSIKDEVYIRDKGRCTYVGTGGRRCVKKDNLEVDHIIPFAKGGKNIKENLRLLCARHNMLEAGRAYGKDHMKSFRRRE